MKSLKFIHITKTAGTSIEDVSRKAGLFWGRFHKEYAKRWHKPFTTIDKTIREKYDWFTVVRNPYDRILSEFYCRWITPIDKNVSIEQFNKQIQSHILHRQKHRQSLDFHYTEQYLYIDNSVVIHILKFENLFDEFNRLMQKYNIKITLDVKTNVGKKQYTIEDFNVETICLINHVYEKDFSMFNYEMKKIGELS